MSLAQTDLGAVSILRLPGGGHVLRLNRVLRRQWVRHKGVRPLLLACPQYWSFLCFRGLRAQSVGRLPLLGHGGRGGSQQGGSCL